MKSDRHIHTEACRPLPSDVFTGDFDLDEYFRTLTRENLLARLHDFRFHVVSGLDGMIDALESMMDSSAFVAVSDDAFTSVDASTSPSLMRQKVVFLAMRHAPDDPSARSEALHTLRELARQFLARMLHDRPALAARRGVAFSPDVAVNETDRYLSPGTAILFMNIGYHFKASLVYNATLWEEQ